jgi:hypothetical protein
MAAERHMDANTQSRMHLFSVVRIAASIRSRPSTWWGSAGGTLPEVQGVISIQPVEKHPCGVFQGRQTPQRSSSWKHKIATYVAILKSASVRFP